MPDIYGEPLPSEKWGTSESCANCGGPVPTMEDQHCMIYEEDGEQLCAECSPNWNKITDYETGEDLTPS